MQGGDQRSVQVTVHNRSKIVQMFCERALGSGHEEVVASVVQGTEPGDSQDCRAELEVLLLPALKGWVLAGISAWLQRMGSSSSSLAPPVAAGPGKDREGMCVFLCSSLHCHSCQPESQLHCRIKAVAPPAENQWGTTILSNL